MKSADYQYAPKEGFVLTHFLTVADVKRSADFYLRILGGKVIRSGEPTIIQIAKSWLVLNLGGGPTDDKPTISLHTPRTLMNIVASLTFVSGQGYGELDLVLNCLHIVHIVHSRIIRY